MRKIGIVGGVGWRATADYYAKFCTLAEERSLQTGVHSMPEIAIESLDLQRAWSLLSSEDWTGFDAYHRDALLRLERSGAEIAVIASNTPHDRFEQIIEGVSVPVVDIFESAATRCAQSGQPRVLVLGTEITMNSARLRRVFARHGLECHRPEQASIEQTESLIRAIQQGRLKGGPELLANLVFESLGSGATDAVVCLACTDLPVLFGAARSAAIHDSGLIYVDPSVAHVEDAYERASH